MLTSKQIEQNEQLTEDYGYGHDYEEYLDAIIAIRKEALKQRLEEHSMKVNSLHRGTKE